MPQNSMLLKLAKPAVVAASTLVAGFFLWMIQVRGLAIIPGFSAILHIGLPDMMFTYAPHSIFEKLTQFGSDGRLAYRLFLERIDSIFPAVYGLFFLSATAFTLLRLFPTRPGLQQLSLFTLGTTLFDYAENVCFLAFLRNFPQELPTLERIANVLTLAKWAFALFSISLLVHSAFRVIFLTLRGSRVPRPGSA
jgi:hypothetical protein